MKPTPPSWIVKALRAFNPRFGIAWDDGRKMWAITEDVRIVSKVGTFGKEGNGTPVFKMHRRPEPALRFKGLGSKILGYVRRNDPRKYRGVREMVANLKIDEGKRPSIVGGLP